MKRTILVLSNIARDKKPQHVPSSPKQKCFPQKPKLNHLFINKAHFKATIVVFLVAFMSYCISLLYSECVKCSVNRLINLCGLKAIFVRYIYNICVICMYIQ